MNIDWFVFLFGVLAFLIGSLAILIAYAGAAIEEAQHERTALARLTLRICRAMGMLERETPGSKERPSGGDAQAPRR
jgi:hypothetical protein